MDMEYVPDYRGSQFIGEIYAAVRKKKTITIEYKSFRARKPACITVYPYLLKEYRNRWFLISEKVSNASPKVNIFALDRIHSVKIEKKIPFKKCLNFDPAHYFDDTIGVTRDITDEPRHIVLKIDRNQAPYVESKPFHKSQIVEQRFYDGSIQIVLDVVINNELERLILGYGEHIEVIAPLDFRKRIAKCVRKAASQYE